jgi:death on curing protein
MTFVYLTLDDVLAIHDMQISRFGGAPGVRDAGLVEAAVFRPQSGYYDTLIEQAAALWESLGMNHGFVDGNKRVAFAAMQIFLRLNGHSIFAHQSAIIDFIVGNLDGGTFRKDVLQEWLERHVKPRGEV